MLLADRRPEGRGRIQSGTQRSRGLRRVKWIEERLARWPLEVGERRLKDVEGNNHL